MKGLILSNFIYLFAFLIFYYVILIMVRPLIFNQLDKLTDNFIVTYNITDYRTNEGFKFGLSVLDFILYILVPIVAIVWVVRSSQPIEYYER